MDDMLEPLGEVRPDALRRREGIGHFGMLRLQTLEFLEKHVEILVADFGGVQHIIIVVVTVELSAELFDSLYGVHAKMMN